MRLRLKRSALSFGLPAVLLALLPLLAWLQYRWIGQLSDAERERMQANVRMASTLFAREFDTEITRAALAFHAVPPMPGGGWDRFAAQHAWWLRNTSRHELIRTVYAIETREDGGPRLLRSNPEARRFEEIAWLPRFDGLARTAASRVLAPPPHAPLGPGWGRPPFEWSIDGQLPALLLWLPRGPQPGFRRPAPPADGPPEPRPSGCLVIELDLDYIRGDLLPELARKHFADLYHVAVASASAPRAGLYVSHPETPFAAFSSADIRTGILALRPGELRHMFPDMPPPSPPDGGDMRPGPGQGRRGGWFLRAFPAGDGLWRVYVRHPAGSLEAAVAGVRKRNLAVSFGILLLMAATVALIIASARRAQNLARLQMEFMAGISHDLLTPLAVIRSAADNLADGLVEGRQQAAKYGDLIRKESRGLSEMVRQTLDYAGLQYQRRRYDFRPLDAAELIRQALEACGLSVKESGIEIDERIDPGMPPVTGDAGALTMCVRNLVSNALKYGKDGGRIEIAARKDGGQRPPGVAVTVADRGPGIDPEDLARIFEPFFRGRQAVASRAHGTGLGLSLVKRIVEDHGGSVTVKSAPGQGSAFTMHLPASRQAHV